MEFGENIVFILFMLLYCLVHPWRQTEMAIWMRQTPKNCLLEKRLLLYKEAFLLCHAVAEVHMTQWFSSARATRRNCKTSYTLFGGAECDTDLSI